MNILILGNGARERIIQDKLLREAENKVCMMNTQKFEDIKLYIINNKIDLVIPSTEAYLCDGIVDYLETELPDIKVFGPNKTQAEIEKSKCFSKWCMKELNIPTADYQYFSTYMKWCKSNKNDLDYTHPPVLKYTGLAQGKGVYLPQTSDELHENIEKLFTLGEDGIIIEDRLFGTEVSVLAFCNGKEAVLMPQAQDYKSVYDGNKGPNTGGMGAICPANILTEEELKDIKCHMDKIVKKLNYKGVLYAGLMKTADGVFFLEFNCRFGDPEAQVILSLLDSPLCDIMISCIEETTVNVKWKNKSAAAVILSHRDYPKKKLDRQVIMSYDYIDPSIKIYESNVKFMDGMKLTTGGRVLSMVSVDENLPLALQNIYNNIYKITFSGSYYRRDIGCNNILPKTTNNVPIGILASGNGTCLEYLLEANILSVKIIITNNSKNGIYKSAFKYKIPFLYIPHKGETPTKYYEKIVNIFRLYDIELIILAGYMKIVPSTIYNEFTTINIHPSLLPNYGGLMDMVVHESVIKNKEAFSGCTLHQVIKDVDKGRILLQKQCPIDPDENSVTLKQKVQELEKQCILDYINQYNAYKIKIPYEVDVEQGNDFVNDLKKSIKGLGGFCAEYKYKGLRIAAAADGCGTKLDLANTYDKLNTIGIDLVAMNVNDLIAGGAKPLFFMDYIAVDKMDRKKCNTIIRGIQTGCFMCECELIGGETAEMKGTYLKNKLDLAGFAIGEIVFDLPKKEKMKAGNILYGIKSSGVHSNGYTLVNKLLQNSTTQPHIDDLLAPTFIYTNVMKLWNTFPDNILGISHITGGGFHDNITRILSEELYFKLEEWEFPPIFQWIQRESGLSREEMMKTFNCGYGMVIISDTEFNPDYDLDLDLGFELEMIGELVRK